MSQTRIMGEEPLLRQLHEIQDKYGYLSEDSLKSLSKKTGIPLAKIYSTASFYSFFNFKKPSKNTVRICNSPSCYLNGSTDIIKTVQQITKLRPGESNSKFDFEIVQCIGCCDKAPAMMLNNKVHTSLTKEKIKEILKKC